MRIVGISDSPKLTTGFGQVAAKIYEGFHKAGHEVMAYGFHDPIPDAFNQLPYSFWPASPVDLMGYEDSVEMINRVEPDVVWIMADPGNLVHYLNAYNQLRLERQSAGLKSFEIVQYPPVEGRPFSPIYADAFRFADVNNIKTIVWNDTANVILKEAGLGPYPVVKFGLDHLPVVNYSPDNVTHLRKLVGLDDFFLVSSVGVNKRTKGYPWLIYAAEILKQRGYGDKIRFYCHTEADYPTMQGHHLRQLAMAYGVGHMFLFKPDSNNTRGNIWAGISRFNNTLEATRGLTTPDTMEGRGQLWSRYDFVSRLLCSRDFGMYMDTSGVEGWGLPLGEAMVLGVPSAFPNDWGVRNELYGGGAYVYPSLPPAYWETWHTMARLVTLDPEIVANTILAFYRDKDLRDTVATKGRTLALTYKWENTQKEMVELVEGFMSEL